MERRADTTAYGWLALAHRLATPLGVAEAINEHVEMLKLHMCRASITFVHPVASPGNAIRVLRSELPGAPESGAEWESGSRVNTPARLGDAPHPHRTIRDASSGRHDLEQGADQDRLASSGPSS